MMSATFRNLRKVLLKKYCIRLLLYVSVALHVALLSLFLFSLEDGGLQMYEVVGRIFSMGLVTTFAINWLMN